MVYEGASLPEELHRTAASFGAGARLSPLNTLAETGSAIWPRLSRPR